jgi:hypothetical protein
MSENAITGTVIGLRDCGILVIVYLDAEDGRTVPVVLDRCLFQQCLDHENGDPSRVIGCRVRYDGQNLSLER